MKSNQLSPSEWYAMKMEIEAQRKADVRFVFWATLITSALLLACMGSL